MKIRKLIQIKQESIIKCTGKDHKGESCEYEIPYTEKRENFMWKYINVPCPRCNTNLLTVDEYTAYTRLMKTVRFINKWFSWMTVTENWFIKK